MKKSFLKCVAAAVTLPIAVVAVQPTVPAFAAPTPVAELASEQLQPFIGEQTQFVVAFDNDDVATGDTGYGPYVDLRFNAAGADGDDGVTFGSASFLGAAVAPLTTITCTGAAVVHPLTTLSVPCPIGTQLVIVQLPFGSFTAGQPIAHLDVSATISNKADVGVALAITATPGFAYGNSPTGTTATVGTASSISLTPQAIRFTKTYIGPEHETATGPNYPRGFRLSLDVATGITVNNIQLTDVLPAQYQFLAVTGTSHTATAIATPPTATPGGTLTRGLATVLGTAATEDAWIEFSYYIPEFAAGDARILDTATGDDVLTLNDGAATVQVVPLDIRDVATTVTINPNSLELPNPDNVEMTAKSIAIQKSVEIAVPSGDDGYTPGDVLEYTLHGQISDYFTFNDIVVNDILGDGQSYLDSYTPMLSITNRGVVTSFAIESAYTTIDSTQRPSSCAVGSTGTTGITYNVSDAYRAEAPSFDGFLTGGSAIEAGLDEAATFTIAFRATIDDAYTCSPSPDNKLDPRDFVTNHVTVSGDVYANSPTGTPTTKLGDESDDSNTSVEIAPTTLLKAIHARNGVVGGFTGSPGRFAANDWITYRLTMHLPSSDISGLTISDYLPLPILTATPLTESSLGSNKCVSASDLPGLNKWCFGPSDTFQGAFSQLPTVAASTEANSISWVYDSREAVDNLPRTIDLLFTLRISDAAFREGLFLTNQVQAFETNSFGSPWSTPAITQIELTEPMLNIDKGIVAVASNAAAAPTFSTGRFPSSDVTSFGNAGSAGCARTPVGGLVTTANTADGFPNADVTGVDAKDVVRFAIMVENTGAGLNGAFDTTISDTVPAGFQIPSTGLNLCVTNGSGTALGHTDTGFFTQPAGTASPLGTGTIRLTDAATTGAIGPRSTTGTNIALITYDLQVIPTIAANTIAATLLNTATITRYAAFENGPDFTSITPAPNLVDTASVATAPITISKALTSTSSTTTTDPNIAIGEQATYTVTLRVPEGTTQNVRVVDTLPAGLALVDSALVSLSPSSGTTYSSSTQTIGTGGGSLTVDLGTVTNTDNVGGGTITMVYRVVALDVISNQQGTTLTNSAKLTYTNGQGASSSPTPATANVVVVEPNLNVTKSASSPSVDADDLLTYTIQIAHDSVSTAAHDVDLRDVIPAGLTYQPGTLTLASELAPDAGTLVYNVGANQIEAHWTAIPVASTISISFSVKVAANYQATSPFLNTARTAWTSLPGSPSSTTNNAAGHERTGADGPGGALDDYAEDAAVTVQPIAPKIVKSLHDTDQTSTTGNNVTIGEGVTYRLVVTLPEGDFPSGLVIVDQLPTGLQYVGPAVVDSGGFNGTLATPTITSGGASGDDVTFTFGASSVVPDSVSTNNSFSILVSARVLDIPANKGLAPGQITLTNTSTVQLVGGALVTSNGIGTPVVEPRIALTKTMAPTAPSQGDPIAMSITATNNGTGNGYGTVITDQLDASFDWTTLADVVVPVGWTQDTYNSVTGTLVFRLADPASFDVGATFTFTFTATLKAILPIGIPIPNTAVASGVTTVPGVVPGERTEPNNTGVAQINTAGPDLRLTKDDGKTTVTPTNPTAATNTYNLVVTNTGGFQATGVSISDTLPAGTTFVSVGGDGRCTDGGVVAGVRLINISGAIPATNGTVTCTMTIAITYPAPVGTLAYFNSAIVADDGTNGADPTPANNTATDSDTFTGKAPDLVVTKTDGVTSLTPGESTTYTITVTNNGNVGVTDVLVTDTVPAGMTYVSCAPATGTVSVGCSSTANIVTTRFATIAGGGGSASFTVTATVNDPVAANVDTVTNTVTAVDDGANGTDPNTANNTATDTDTIDAVPDMRIVKTSTETSVAPGGAVHYTLTVDNHGLQGARNAQVTDTIDALMTLDCASVLPTPTSCNAATGVIVWGSATTGLQPDGTIAAGGTFAAGATTTLTYTASTKNPLPAGTVDFDNTAVVADDGSNGIDPTADNSASRNVTLTGAAPNLKIVKTDGVTSVVPGTPYDYTMTIANSGTIGSANVVVTDALPAGLVLNSCTLDGVTCAPTGTPLTINIGTVAVGTPRVLIYNVTATAPAAAGLAGFTNTGTVADDGANGIDSDPTDNTSTDIDTLTAAPDLVVTKDDSATSRNAGETFDYEITVTNNGNQNATGVTITDTVSSLLTANDCSPTIGSCTITAGVLTWNVGNLAGGGATASLTLNVTANSRFAAGVTSVSNTATGVDDGTNGNDPTPGNNSATDVDTLVAAPDLTISKTNGVAETTPGSTLTYTIVVNNIGSQTAQNVTVTDTLPPGTTFVSCDPTCDSSVSGTVTWSNLQEGVAGLADSLGFDAGGQRTLHVVVEVDPPAASNLETIVNVVTVADNAANGPDPTPANNSDVDIDTLSAAPDMTIVKSSDDEAVAPGGVADYALVVTNDGDQDARGVTVTDTVDPQMTLDCSTGAVLPAPTSCDPITGVVTWGPGLLANGTIAANGIFGVGESITLTYSAAAANPLIANTVKFTNTATVADDGSNGTDPTSSDNTDTLDVPLTGNGPELSITKTDGVTSVAPGDTVTYTMVVTNNGNIGSTGVFVTDVLPAGLTFESCELAGEECTVGVAGRIDIGALAGGGGTTTLIVTATVDTPAAAGLDEIVNTATVADDASNGPDSVPGNNVSTDTDVVEAAPILTIVKTDDTDSHDAGETYTYTITVTNTGDQDATGVVVTDVVPSPLTVVSCPATPVQCVIAGTTVTWTIGDLPGGNAVGSSRILSLTVEVDDRLADQVDEVSNTASVTDDGHNTGGVAVTAESTDVSALVASPDMAITKTDGETNVEPGDRLTYTITVSNNGYQTATGVDVIDTLPMGTTFVSCTLSCDSTVPGTLTWTSLHETTAGLLVDPAGFDAGGSTVLTVVVDVDSPALAGLDGFTNVVTVTNDGTNGDDPTDGDLGDGDPDEENDNVATDTDVLDAFPDLAITKDDGALSVVGGDEITYQITFANNGNQNATGVSVTDTLPAGVTFVSCSDGCDFSASPTIVWTIGDLAAGDEFTYELTVRIDDPAAAGTRHYVNSVVIADDGDNGADPTPLDNTATDDDTTGIDLAVTKTDGRTSAVPGESLTYTITVTNNGPTTIQTFELIETLPTALQGITITASSGSYDPTSHVWNGFGDFDEGESLTLTVTGIIDPAATGTLTNSVEVRPPSIAPETNPADNIAIDVDTLTPSAQLTLDKQLTSALVKGEKATYSLIVTNTGPSVATGVVITDTPPSVLSFFNYGGAGFSCSPAASSSVICPLDSPLLVGESRTLELTFNVSGDFGSNVTNQASVVSSASSGLNNVVEDTAGGNIAPAPPAPTVPPISLPLPQTGTSVWPALLWGGATMLLGLTLVVGVRRRRAVATSAR